MKINGEEVTLLRALKEYWVLIAAFAAIVSLVGETRWQVKELWDKKSGEIEQWRRINANEDRGKENEGRIKVIEQHVTPQAIQEWGALKEQFREDHRDLQQHLRRHN